MRPYPAERSEKPANVLFVGNLYQQPAKGIDILLHAWRMVHAQFPDAILQIVGDGVYRHIQILRTGCRLAMLSAFGKAA